MAKAVSRKLLIQIVLTASFMLAEFTVGYLANSLALISDSFHMLSDVISLCVGFYARRYGKKASTSKMTYGWKRAEVVGALVNGVFLLALCLNIFLEAIKRFWQFEAVLNPMLVLIIGCIGLFINVLGLIFFHESHAHHHHEEVKPIVVDEEDPHDHSLEEAEIDHKEIESPPVSEGEKDNEKDEKKKKHHHHHHDHDLNLRAVFVHILGDALGSLGVIASGLIMWLTDFPQRFYVDPSISLFITAIILKTAIPLVRQSSRILLQGVPDYINLDDIKGEILKIEGVMGIHELHVWQLISAKLVASVHITCLHSDDFMDIAHRIKTVLHKHRIHSTTIQPEFVGEEEEIQCHLRCASVNCDQDTCCAPPTLKEKLIPAK